MATGVLLVGVNGSIATTTTAGVFASRLGLCPLRGVITEGPDFAGCGLVPVDDLLFGGWDIANGDDHGAWASQRAEAGAAILEAVRDRQAAVEVFAGVRVGTSAAMRQLADFSAPLPDRACEAARIEAEIRDFIARNRLDGAVIINLSSTEPPLAPAPWQQSLSAFEAALDANQPDLPAGAIYAYAGLRAGCPLVNFTPSDFFEMPALIALAEQRRLPLAGRDGKTGQTFYKTVLASALKQRALTVDGWYSTNILGNTDGLVLGTPENSAAKKRTKLGVLERILGYPVDHQVRIDYYRPRRAHKEAWDCVDMRGWLDADVQMRINWIAPDSALAAPMVIDLARLIWSARQQGRGGVQGHLGAFFKEPLDCPAVDFAAQFALLLRELARQPAPGRGLELADG